MHLANEKWVTSNEKRVMKNEEMTNNMRKNVMRSGEEQYGTERHQGRARPFLIFTFAFLFSHFSFLISHAQTFTQRIQKESAGQGTLTIHQSDSIDRLVNTAILGGKSGKSGSSNQAGQPNHSQSQSGQSRQANQGGTTTGSDNSQANQPGTASQPVSPQEDTTAKPVRNSYKTNGYRVQAFAGGNSRVDRQQAERVRNSIKAYFPNVPVYVHFYSPRWICRVGNYRTYEEAHQMLVSLRNMGYNQASVVKTKIVVSY